MRSASGWVEEHRMEMEKPDWLKQLSQNRLMRREEREVRKNQWLCFLFFFLFSFFFTDKICVSSPVAKLRGNCARPSPYLSQWQLLEGFHLVPTESRTVSDHWAQGRWSSGCEGGADRNPSQDMLGRPKKAALLSSLQTKVFVGLWIWCLGTQIQ